MLTVGIMLGSLALGGALSTAQEATPATGDDHPFVGTWLLDTDPQNPDNPATVGIASSDGSYFEADVDGLGIGVWEATGETSAIMTFRFMVGDIGMGIVRADIEFAPDGQSFSGQYTVEFFTPDGQSPGEAGPGTVEATRMTAEAPGDPVLSLEELFGGFEQATPEG